MKQILSILIILLAAAQPARAAQNAAGADYVVLGEDLKQLKDDFNAKAGTVRLLFILGPTCGVCLRGMVDLNDEFLADYQSDPRLATFAVHVPTLRAEEKNLPPAIALMKGPRIRHYWDDSGMIGILYQDILDTEAYVWDVWFIYGPEAVWDGEAPPAPDFWQHQLPAFPHEQRLDKKTFAAETIARINELDRVEFNADSAEAGDNPLADGTVIPWVGQGFGRAISEYRDGQGGMAAVRAAEKRRYRGRAETAGGEVGLTIVEGRPNRLEIRAGDDYVLRRSDDGLERRGAPPAGWLPKPVEERLFGHFDFDSTLIDWSAKGHKFEMQGMEKLGDVLAWKLVEENADGSKWAYLVNSHNGRIEAMRALGEADEVVFALRYLDYQPTDGYPMARRVEISGPAGERLAVWTFDEIGVERAPASSGQ